MFLNWDKLCGLVAFAEGLLPSTELQGRAAKGMEAGSKAL